MRDRELESTAEAYQRLAERDWLTGLYNRGTTERKVNEWITAETAGTLIFLDLDHFKQINDRYGHITGDSLLQSVGDTLHKMFPEPNLVGRIGGDEFIIFVRHTMDDSGIISRCAQVRGAFSGSTYPGRAPSETWHDDFRNRLSGGGQLP